MEPISVMIVEDDRIMLEDMLGIYDWTASGFPVVATALNGKQGLERFAAVRPQLVITDVQMPAMDGLTMLKQIRKIDPHVGILIFSAYEEFEYAKEALRLGATDYILKTEISTQLIGEKLTGMRRDFELRSSKALESAKAGLHELVSGIGTLSRAPDALANIAASLPRYNAAENFALLAEFSVRILRTGYAVRGMTEHLELPQEIHGLEPLFGWLEKEIGTLEMLDDAVHQKHCSPVIVNALSYIHKHYGNPELKIGVIASKVGLSPSRLCYLFKKELGKTINDAITEMRIEAARRLLLSGEYKVYEVAELVGYQTSQYFSQVFCQYTGQSPNKFRMGTE